MDNYSSLKHKYDWVANKLSLVMVSNHFKFSPITFSKEIPTQFFVYISVCNITITIFSINFIDMVKYPSHFLGYMIHGKMHITVLQII